MRFVGYLRCGAARNTGDAQHHLWTRDPWRSRRIGAAVGSRRNRPRRPALGQHRIGPVAENSRLPGFEVEHEQGRIFEDAGGAGEARAVRRYPHAPGFARHQGVDPSVGVPETDAAVLGVFESTSPWARCAAAHRFGRESGCRCFAAANRLRCAGRCRRAGRQTAWTLASSRQLARWCWDCACPLSRNHHATVSPVVVAATPLAGCAMAVARARASQDCCCDRYR